MWWRAPRGATMALVLALLGASAVLQAAAHAHGSEHGCGHHHPDVMAQSVRLWAQRLAHIELREGPAEAAAAAARAEAALGGGASGSAQGSAAAAGGAAGAPGGVPHELRLLQLLESGKAARLEHLRAQTEGAGSEQLGSSSSGSRSSSGGGGGGGGGSSSGSSSGSGSDSGSGAAAASRRRLAAASQAPRAPLAPIRIRPVYQLRAVPPKPAARIRDEIIPTAVAALRKYVSVKRPGAAPQDEPRPFDGRQSCLAEDPTAGAGADKGSYDLLLYVTGDSSRCFPGMVAMSAACEVDPKTGRPTVGSLNICAEALASTSTGQAVDTVVHEVLHVLGFSPSHYPDWRGPDGKRYDRPIVRIGPRKAPFLATPAVLREARRQFGCDSLPGAPLETEGMGMSSLAHWEYRNTQHELMTAARPMDRGRAVMSRITLAALEDSGWYAPNYTAAADLEWGRGAGCDFVMASCREFMAANPRQDLFCPQDQGNAPRCSAGGRLWGKCRGSSFTDGCLIVGREAPKAAGPGGAASDYSGNFDCMPADALDNATRALLPKIGASGTGAADRCIPLTAPAGAAEDAPTVCVAGAGAGGKPACTAARALCFRVACDAKGALSVVLQAAAAGGAATKLACPTGTTLNLGAKATGRFASGALQCPDNARACRGVSCGACDPDGGFCSFADGRCHCWLERTGPGCSQSVLGPKKAAG